LVAPRQRADFALVLSASRVTPWARRVLYGHATATINSSGTLGNDGFGPTRLAKPSIASTLGTAATLRSTARSRDVGSWKKLTERRGPWWRCSATRLASDYPRGDRSYLVDEEVSNFEIDGEGLASSRRRRTHGTLSVRAIVVRRTRRTRRTPRLTTSLGTFVPIVEEEGYSYLVRLLVVSRGSPIAPLALARCCWRSRANLDNFLGFRYPKTTFLREALPDFGLVTS